MIGVEDLIVLVQSHFGDNNGDKTESSKIIDLFSSRVDSIPTLYNFIQKTFPSVTHLHFAFLSMKNIMMRRGCLVGIQQLMGHLDFIFNFIEENMKYLIDNHAVLINTTDAIGITFLHLFHKKQEMELRQVLERVKTMYTTGIEGQIIALYVNMSIVDAMDGNYFFLETNERGKLKDDFKNMLFADFIESALNAMGNNISVSIIAFKLLKSCFNLADTIKNDTFQLLTLPSSFSILYKGPGALSVIFSKFDLNDENLGIEIFHVLDYLLRASDHIWLQNDDKIQFFLFAAEEMKNIMIQISPDSKSLNEATRSIAHICNRVKSGAICIDNSWIEFVNSCEKFTMIALEGPYSNYTNITKIWSLISQWKMEPENVEFFFKIFFNILKNIVTAVFHQIERSPEMMIDDIKNTGIHDLKTLWEISKVCYLPFAQFIDQQFDIKLDEGVSESCSPATLLQINYLITLISSQNSGTCDFKSESDIPYYEVENLLCQKIFAFVEQTTELIERFALTNGIYAVELERSLVHYISDFHHQKFPDNFGAGSALTELEEVYFTMLQLFIQRIMCDLSLFHNVEECGTLLVDILNVFESITKRKSSKQLLVKNEVIQDLFSRRISFEFEEINVNEMKMARTKLYSLYASFIQDRRNLLLFISQFDERFKNITGVSNEFAVFALYTDLLGVVKGFEKNYNYLSKFLLWFSTNHVDETVSIIKAYATSSDIVSAVTSLWVMIYEVIKNHKTNNFALPGIGIILFRSSSLIVGAFYENCEHHTEQTELLVELIYSCLTSVIANFGIMKHYDDNSINDLLSYFFGILDSFSYSILSQYQNILLTILKICKHITEQCSKELLPYNERLQLILNITLCSLASRIKETWQLTWNILRPLMIYANESNNTNLITCLRPHFVHVLDAILNTNDTYTYDSVELLILLSVHDSAFVNSAFISLIETYDQQFKPFVTAALNRLVDQNSNIDIKNRARTFNAEMKKYPTSLFDCEFFAQYFQT